MNLSALLGVVVGILLMCVSPSFAEVPVNVIAPMQSYKADEFAVTFPADARCDRTLYGELSHSRTKLLDHDSAKVQAAMRSLAKAVQKDCRKLNTFIFSTTFADGSQDSNMSLRDTNWSIDGLLTAQRPQFQQDEQAARQRLSAFKAREPQADHDLVDYGYYKAEMVGETDTFKLYWTQDRKLYGGKAHYVVLHTTNGATPFFDTQRFDEHTLHTGAEFNRQLEELINAKPRVFMEAFVNHHVAGYHNPNDDRAKVLSENYSEKPLFQTRLPAYWDGGRYRISPYGSQLRGVNKLRKIVLNMDDVITAFGPSAVANLTDPLALPDFGPLADEGPSPDFRSKQAQVRSKLLAKGLIYKNDAFWAQFRSPETRRLFEAHADWLAVGEVPSAALMMTYLRLNSERCAATIKNPQRFKLDSVTTYSDDYGNTSQSSSNIFDIVVPGRFAPILKENYQQEDGSLMSGAKSAMSFLQSGRSLQSIAKEQRQTIDWVERSQSDVQRIMAYGPCGNPVQKQFEEMLYLDAVGKNPETNTTLSFANAATQSDGVYQPGNAPTLTAACLLSSDFGAKQMTSARKAHRWCECLANGVKSAYPDRVAKYTKRYGEYQRDIQIAKLRIERGQDHPENRIYAVQSNCVGK